MGQYDEGFQWEEQTGNEQNSGKALREARDKAAAEAKDLKTQLDEALAKLTERNLKDVLQGKSLNPGLAKWIAQDGIDGSDPAKVEEWLTTNAELIGYKAGTPDGPGEEDPRAAEFRRMQGAQDNALPAGKFTEAASQIEKAEEIADVNKILAQARQFG